MSKLPQTEEFIKKFAAAYQKYLIPAVNYEKLQQNIERMKREAEEKKGAS
jgi:hypothetical protein